MQRASTTDSSGERSREQQSSRAYAPEAAETTPPQGWNRREMVTGESAAEIQAAPLPSRWLFDGRRGLDLAERTRQYDNAMLHI